MKCHTPKNFPKLSYTFYILFVIYLFICFESPYGSILSPKPDSNLFLLASAPNYSDQPIATCLLCKIFLNFHFT